MYLVFFKVKNEIFLMEDQATGPWSMIFGIVLGVGFGFLVVWGAWKMMPYMYNILFPPKSQTPTDSRVEKSPEEEMND